MFRKRIPTNKALALDAENDLSGDAFDQMIVEKTLHEDKNAFRGIVEKYTPQLCSLAFKMTGSNELKAEEAVQEIFLKIFRSLGTYNSKKRFFPWAYTIAVNHLRSELRKSYKEPQMINMPYDDILVENTSSYADPEHEFMRAEGDRLVQKALKELKPKHREVFILRQIQGLSVLDTAQVLSIPEGSVKNLLFRARKEMIAALNRMQWT